MEERLQQQGASDLPTGTVTFLLTDIVGSTTLWDEAPRAMQDAMERHDALVDDAVAVHRGRVIRPRGEGDSRFAVFTRASDAVSAAIDLQVGLHAVDWPTPEPLQVRTAIHTGEADPRMDDYYGTTVNRCARLRGLAAPGQVLVSEVTASLVRVERLPAVEFRDLGTHHLRGLAAPERVFQLCHPDLPDDFPPPASEDEDGLELPAGRQVPLALPLQPPDGIPFVGRGDELGRLWQSWHLVQEGRAQVVLVNGAPGMGKTRLAAEFAIRVHDEGATVLVGRCDEEALRSYQPFAEAIGSYLRWWSASAPPVTASHLPAELAWLVPELAPRLPVPPTSLLDDPETDRVRLFEAVVSVLGELGRENPVLLVLDDLHWADHSTVLLLRHLVRRSDAAPVMVLGTSRSGAEGRDLSDAIADFGREERVRRVALGGLGQAEVGALLRSSAARGALTGTAGEIQDLHDVTGGNPFFIKQVVHQIAEQDVGSVGVALRSVAPEGVRDLVGQRLAGLSSPAAALLRLAAVIGREFDLGLLARTSDHSDEEALDLLEEAEAAFLVEEDPEVVDRFLFSHALVRNVIYRSLSASRRARLHRHVGEVLEEAAPPGDQAVRELAHHFLEAALTGDAEKAVRYAMAAADSAMASLAFEDAAELCRRALGLLADLPSPGEPNPAIEVDLLMGLGLAERRAGRRTGRTALLRAFDRAMALGDLSRAAASVLALNRGFFARMGRPDRELITALEQVIAANPPGDSRVQAELLATLASELVWARDGERRFALSDQALAMARRLGDREALARALLLRNMTISAPDTLDERAVECSELLELAVDLEDPVLWFHAAFQRSGTAVEAGDIDGAEEMVDVASMLAGDLRQPGLLWQAGFMETSQRILAGALEDAERSAVETLERGRCAQQEGEAMIFYTEEMLEIRRWQGRLPEMVESIRELAGVDGIDFGYSLVRYLFDAGEEAAAVARYREVVERLDLPVRRDLLAATTLVNLAYLAAKVGEAEQLDRLRELLTPFSGVFASTTVAKPVGAHFLGMLAAASGDVPGAEALFRTAVAAHERARAPLFLAETKLEWASLLVQVDGRRADVDALVDAARDVAEVHGAGLLQRRADALLDAIGR